MSHLQYFVYEGFGERVRKDFHASQAVRVDNRIEISGQCGLDPITEKIPKDVNEQVDLAFANVELTLQKAGGKGWDQVYKVRAYCTPMNEELFVAVARNLKKYCPNHQPILTGVEVAGLYEGCCLELEVAAHLG
ncbi:YjgF-like protein [Lojkania enalia]|uniref:YjgF-like protein n=1 Tax=Lojkania enalia TaxID=147567 RepID=A0A9P4K818_9PLEO|nr:YjgF-like protein [Didymosphaeria enalia]